MSRRLLLASGGAGSSPGGGIVIPPGADPLDYNPGTVPYDLDVAVIDGSRNAPVYATTPTPDGTGSTVHPDVIDFFDITESGLWHGWRFWMAHTPYWQSDDDNEQPNILVSSDGFTWQTPTGAAPQHLFLNTIPNTIQGDTDLVYDPDEDRLIMMWVEFNGGPGWVYVSESTDGVTWSPRHAIITETSGDAGTFPFSPAMVRVGPGDWRIWARRQSSTYPLGYMLRYTATDPFAPWTYAGIATPGVGDNLRFWHLDVIRHEGRFLGLFSFVSNYAAVSNDGITWTTTAKITSVRPKVWLAAPKTHWDTINMYRGTIQPHINGEDMRVWYSAEGHDENSWRIGYIKVPMSLWDAP